MADHIPEIKQRLDIVRLANDFGLKVTKNNFIHSIYKEEKTPSMKLYPEENRFHCYATGTKGDIINFWQDLKGLNTNNTILELKEIAGITDTSGFSNKASSQPIAEAFEEERSSIEQMQHEIFEKLEIFCCGLSKEAEEYLTGPKRGLIKEILAKNRLFSIKDVESTRSYFLSNYSMDELKISGLFNPKGNFIFCYHTIIIPYIENDAITCLKGRYFHKGNPEPGESAKYISLNNQSNTLSSKRFYNVDQLKGLSKGEPILVCEGEFDTLAALQTKTNAIGIPGVSNFPKDQVEMLKNYTIYLAMDNDEAGEAAAREICELIGKPIYIIRLKKHKDLSELLSWYQI